MDFFKDVEGKVILYILIFLAGSFIPSFKDRRDEELDKDIAKNSVVLDQYKEDIEEYKKHEKEYEEEITRLNDALSSSEERTKSALDKLEEVREKHVTRTYSKKEIKTWIENFNSSLR
jgi:chromosome segregation ATPase